MHFHVILNLFQDLATVEIHGYSKQILQGRNMGQTLKQVQGDMSVTAGLLRVPNMEDP